MVRGGGASGGGGGGVCVCRGRVELIVARRVRGGELSLCFVLGTAFLE